MAQAYPQASSDPAMLGTYVPWLFQYGSGMAPTPTHLGSLMFKKSLNNGYEERTYYFDCAEIANVNLGGGNLTLYYVIEDLASRKKPYLLLPTTSIVVFHNTTDEDLSQYAAAHYGKSHGFDPVTQPWYGMRIGLFNSGSISNFTCSPFSISFICESD
jgi:hypothetical protein